MSYDIIDVLHVISTYCGTCRSYVICRDQPILLFLPILLCFNAHKFAAHACERFVLRNIVLCYKLDCFIRVYSLDTKQRLWENPPCSQLVVFQEMTFETIFN